MNVFNINVMKVFLFLLLCLICLTDNISAQDYEWSESRKAEFKQDTAHLEQEVRVMLDKDYSTYGMMEASRYLEQGYDKLLNKYYKVLLGVLNDENKALLRASQRNWISLRDSEKKLVWGMKNQTYEESGGGTIWGVIAAGADADITRRRVFELYELLMFSTLN